MEKVVDTVTFQAVVTTTEKEQGERMHPYGSHEYIHTEIGHYASGCTVQGTGYGRGVYGSGECHAGGFGYGVGVSANESPSLLNVQGNHFTGGHRRGDCTSNGEGEG